MNFKIVHNGADITKALIKQNEDALAQIKMIITNELSVHSDIEPDSYNILIAIVGEVN
jgi:hypothetical protein